MSTVAQRVDIVEDRLDLVERLMQQAAERADRIDEGMERDREEWGRRMQRIDPQRERDREEWDRRMQRMEQRQEAFDRRAGDGRRGHAGAEPRRRVRAPCPRPTLTAGMLG